MGLSKHERKKISREAMAESVRKDLEELKKSDAWLQMAEGFDHNLRLSPEKRSIAKRLFQDLMIDQRGYKLKQKELDFEVLVANLLYHRHRGPVAISLNRNEWRSNRYTRASYFIIKREGLIDVLLRNGLIEMRKGYGHETKSRAERTKIWPTERLIEIFKPIRREHCVFDPVELVNLRDENKRPIDYRDTKETWRVRKILRKVNTVCDQAVVQRVSPKSRRASRLRTRLHCVYNGDFKHGGRLYTSDRDGYQRLSEEDRKYIQIDGEPTVEWDFSGFHPRMLYAWEGIQYDDDPYNVGMDDQQLRPIIKDLVLILINAKDEVAAVRAGNKLLRDKRKYYRLLREHRLKVKDDLIPMIKEVHQPIEKYFCTNAGLKVMNVDAKIALDVISNFVNDGIPILSIHDSFIVQRQYERRLYKAMHLAYKKRTGGFRCPIK